MATFHINLSPQRRDDRVSLEKRGETLILNGEIFDPSVCSVSQSNQWVVGVPEAVDDGWSITMILPHGWPAPRATRFPKPLVVSEDGLVELPLYQGPDEDQETLFSVTANKLAGRAAYKTRIKSNEIIIPDRLMLGELPDGVYFSEMASPFDQFPAFGAIVAHVIATASLLELEMLRPAVSQHGSESLLAIRTAFTALDHDEGKKRRYIQLVAEKTGRPRVWQTIQWVYKYSKPVFEIRNMFAHHIWGQCSALPNALLLAHPTDRLIGHAAYSQLLGYQAAEAESQILMRIANGEGGSKLSDADTKILFEMAITRQNNPMRAEAFNMVFDSPLDVHAPIAEVWTSNDFNNIVIAANSARKAILPRLQQMTQWLNGLLTEDDLDPLPTETRGKGKR